MGVLVDWQIRDLCRPGVDSIPPMIDPFSEEVRGDGVMSFGLSSHGYDLRLAEDFVFIQRQDFMDGGVRVDPKRMGDGEYQGRILRRLKTNMPVEIPPNSTVLGTSLEYIRVPKSLMGNALGKSSYARCGIICYITPLESGWEGNLVIEISNLNPIPAVVYPLQGIVQLTFHTLEGIPERDYAKKAGKYFGQTGVTLAKVL